MDSNIVKIPELGKTQEEIEVANSVTDSPERQNEKERFYESKKALDNEEDHERFERILKEFTEIRNGYVVKTLKWYKTNAPRNHWSFRITGVVIILLSVSVPFLATLNGNWENIVLPIAALLIAGLTGLNSFFQWHEAWIGYRQTQYMLEYLLAKWDFESARAVHHPNKKEAIKIITEATSELIEKTRQVTDTETKGYFERVEVPQGRTQS